MLVTGSALALGCAGAADEGARGSAAGGDASGGSAYLFVWAAPADSTEPSFLSVVGADPGSPDYGRILATAPAGGLGRAHHTEHVMPAGGRLFANAFNTGRTFVFDLSDPLAPKLEASFTSAGPYAFPHSFDRTPAGSVLATFQNKGDDRTAAGGLVELDSLGNLVRASDAADPADPELLPYSVTVLADRGRVVTTTADMLGVLAGRSVQFWRWPDLALLHTVPLPPGPRGDENLDVAEARLLADGETLVVTTFRCGMYVVEGWLGDRPTPRLVWTFPWTSYEEGDECGLPVVMGRYWVQTVQSTGSLAVLDMSDPLQPKLVDELFLGEEALTHWVSGEPGGDRIALTGAGSLGGRVLLLRLDQETGALSVVDDFRSPGAAAPGVLLGTAEAPASPHGVVFSGPGP